MCRFALIWCDWNWAGWHLNLMIVSFWLHKLHSVVNMIREILIELPTVNQYQLHSQQLLHSIAVVSTDQMASNHRCFHHHHHYYAMIYNLVDFLLVLEANVVCAEGTCNQSKFTNAIDPFEPAKAHLFMQIYRIWFPIARSRLIFRNGRIMATDSFLSGIGFSIIVVTVDEVDVIASYWKMYTNRLSKDQQSISLI